MNKKYLLQVCAVISALSAGSWFILADFGLGISPLTKFFIVFTGVIIGWQAIPAAMLFLNLVRKIFQDSTTSVNQIVR